jgi:asparagine synthase (glutamine-hydrolysing)
MCGLVAWVGAPGSADRNALERALDAIAHRGPDGRGIYVSSDGAVALGHVRLALVSEGNGAQPLHTHDQRLHAVVNGEVYDDARLRQALQAEGHHFTTHSDSEVLLHLYAAHGPESLRKIRGELAFALHDETRNHVFAGRDRFGIKPLVYAVTSEGVWIASEAKALFAAGIAPAWDATSFAHVATHQYLPPSRTMFRGIAALPPGHTLTIDIASRRLSIQPYWYMRHTVPSDAPTEALQARLRDALHESVRLRLRADKPVAFHLSGGIDSTSILALAKQHVASRPQAFTVQFDMEGYAEGLYAEESARSLEVDLHLVAASPEALFAATGDAVFAGETLGINAQLPAKLILSRAIRAAGFRAVLSGEGADEALLGYAHLALDHHAETGANAARASSLQDAVMLPEGSIDAPALRAAFGFVPAFLASKLAIGARFQGLLTGDARRAVQSEESLLHLAEGLRSSGTTEGPHARRSAALWGKLALAGYILRALGDGVEMAASIEGRPPFLDHLFFEEALRVAPDLLFREGTTKWLFREAMRGVVPEPVRIREKHPFLAPPFAAQRTKALRDGLRDALAPSRTSRVPFLDPRKVTAMLDQLDQLDASHASDARAQQAHEPALQLALTTVLMHERFNLGDA